MATKYIFILVPIFLLASCKNCGSDSDGFDDSGMDGIDSFDTDLLDDVEEEDGEFDNIVDVDSVDIISDALDSEWDLGDAEHLDLVSIVPSRPAMPCGERCRQVTFLNVGDVSVDYDVWESWLIVGALGSPSESITHQVVLVDLSTLNYYIIDETNFNATEDGPAVGIGSIWEEVMIYYYANLTATFTHLRYMFYKVDLGEMTRESFRLYDYPFGGGGQSGVDYMCNFNDYVAWMDDRTGSLGGENIYMMNLRTREEVFVSDHCCYSHASRMYGGNIVYEEGMSGGGMNIWLYDIEAQERRQLTDGDWDQFRPDIYENTVVWTDGRNGGTAMSQTNMDVFGMDLVTGEEFSVSTHPACQKAPITIWGTKVVYADTRNDPEYPSEGAFATEIDIYMTDISTGDEQQLTSLAGAEYFPLIHQNRVYFMKKDLEDLWSIFEITLE